MSHTLRRVVFGNTALVEATIIDYATGGEVFTLAELGLAGAIVSVQFVSVIGQNSGIVPSFFLNKVLLTSAPPAFPALDTYELFPTIGLNFTFLAIVHAT